MTSGKKKINVQVANTTFFNQICNIALISIGFIIDLLNTLVALKNAVLKKKQKNIRTVFVSLVLRINARMNRSRKMRCFILFRDVEVST